MAEKTKTIGIMGGGQLGLMAGSGPTYLMNAKST